MLEEYAHVSAWSSRLIKDFDKRPESYQGSENINNIDML
jgi:hypothetical protein